MRPHATHIPPIDSPFPILYNGRKGGISMTFDLKKDARSRTMIVAHRGVWGGNIPGNTPEAFDAALQQGSDMIELDVSISADGELFVFHPGMERVFLHSDKLLRELPASEIRKLRFHNGDATPTQFSVSTFDEVLEHLKGRCYINVDKFLDNPDPISRAIRRHNMMDQILVKSKPSEDVTRTLEALAPDVSYMLIIKDKDDYTDAILKRNVNYIGAEVLFATEDCEVASREYIDRMHDKNLIVWVNSIVYNYRDVLAAGHNDDISVPGRMDEGWGWLLDRGFDMIQTDWPMMLKAYMERRK